MARRKNDDDEERIDPFKAGYNDAADRLAEFVATLESRIAERDAIDEDIREIYKEIGGYGLEPQQVRRVIALKKKKAKNPEKFERDEAVFNTYCSALGISEEY